MGSLREVLHRLWSTSRHVMRKVGLRHVQLG